jgi:hypothetical protein
MDLQIGNITVRKALTQINLIGVVSLDVANTFEIDRTVERGCWREIDTFIVGA